MYEALQPVSPDPILQLAVLFRNDARRDKLDLGIGVYKDAQGRIPLLESVRRAEALLLESENTKNYVGLAGHEPFNAAIARLVFGNTAPERHIRGVQAVGGQGAVRLLADLVRAASPSASIWISNPSWANHFTVFDHLGMNCRTYSYYSPSSGSVDFDRMSSDLHQARRGDVVLLHGCCHNPTGADLTIDQWQVIADLSNKIGFVPFIDLAYQALGNGIDEDVAGIRLLAKQIPEMLVAYSCSKNFGVYRDRVGCALVLSVSEKDADKAKTQIMALARTNYSMPPHHAAAAVGIVLENPTFKSIWENETKAMRDSMRLSRSHLVSALRLRTNSARFDYIQEHNGLFSLLGLSEEQVDALRTHFGIFMLRNSRINVAGLGENEATRLAAAIVAVI